MAAVDIIVTFFELIIGTIVRLLDSIIFVSTKFFQLLKGVAELLGGGLMGYFFALLTLSLIAFFVLRFIFHSAFSIIGLIIFLIVIFFIFSLVI